MISQLNDATVRIVEANAALDGLIFALHARLAACRKAHARKLERERQDRQPAADAPVPNLWWVGGVIPLDFVGGGGLGKTPGGFGVPGFGTGPKKTGGG